MSLRDIAAGMPHVTATPASITSSPRLLSRASMVGGIIPQKPAHRSRVCFINTPPVLQAFPGSATLQRGFWSRAGARRSQEEALAKDLRNGHLEALHWREEVKGHTGWHVWTMARSIYGELQTIAGPSMKKR